MAEVIQFEDIRRSKNENRYPVIATIVNALIINYVDIDALTPERFARYFAKEDNAAQRQP